jgi:hypothetical protein
MQENVEGIEMAYKLVFADTLKKADPKFAAIIDERIANMEKLIKVDDIKVDDIKVDDIKVMDKKAVHIAGEELAALLLTAAPKLKLKKFKVGDE